MKCEPTLVQHVVLSDGKNVFLKRDDTHEWNGARGTKARFMKAYVEAHPGTKGFVMASSAFSPQVLRMTRACNALKLPCIAFVPPGELGYDVRIAKQEGCDVRQGAEANVSELNRHASVEAWRTGFTRLPFSFRCTEVLSTLHDEVMNLPRGRLVVPVGSGMTLAAILCALHGTGKHRKRVLGVYVCQDPSITLDVYAPESWRDTTELVSAGVPYPTEGSTKSVGGVVIDRVYESHCIPFLRDGDVLWLVGCAQKYVDEHANDTYPKSEKSVSA